MGTRFATSIESPLPLNVKQKIVNLTENDTLYGKNFDGLYARVMKTDSSIKAMKYPMNPVVAAFKAFEAAKLIKLPLYKVLPGLIMQYDKMYQLAQFGAATKQLMAATVDGDLERGKFTLAFCTWSATLMLYMYTLLIFAGVQFVGQSQGLIDEILSASDIMQRCINEANQRHVSLDSLFTQQE